MKTGKGESTLEYHQRKVRTSLRKRRRRKPLGLRRKQAEQIGVGAQGVDDRVGA